MPVVSRSIQLLVVEDSLLFREALIRELSHYKEFVIVAAASDPFEARYEIMLFDPDVMLLDINLPRMNGVEFIRRLMAQYPIPIVVMSANPDLVEQAVRAGALDGVEKPSKNRNRDMRMFTRELTEKLRRAADSFPKEPAAADPVRAQGAGGAPYSNATRGAWLGNGAVTRSPARTQANAGGRRRIRTDEEDGAPAQGRDDDGVSAVRRVTNKRLIAIGASTGGTDAIAAIMSKLPAGLPGIVIVQHMPADFTGMFARRLDNICKFSVREAKNGDKIQQSAAYVAPGDLQMKIVKSQDVLSIAIQQGDKVSGHSPSVDYLFSSVAANVGAAAIGVLLTGMGNDGADGLLKMKNAGAMTIGQDEKSCIVYGMPKVAFDTGAVTYQLPLDMIAQQIMALL